jgi:hypothetical protein
MNDIQHVRLRGCVVASSAAQCPILLWSNLSAWPLFERTIAMARTFMATVMRSLHVHLGLLTVLAFCLAQPVMASEPGGTLHRTDLKPEIQATMFQGTIEAVDRHGLSLTIKTDFGRVLSLSLPDSAAISQLHKGDRVWLEADGQGLLTIRKLNPHDVPLTQDPKSAKRST